MKNCIDTKVLILKSENAVHQIVLRGTRFSDIGLDHSLYRVQTGLRNGEEEVRRSRGLRLMLRVMQSDREQREKVEMREQV